LHQNTQNRPRSTAQQAATRVVASRTWNAGAHIREANERGRAVKSYNAAAAAQRSWWTDAPRDGFTDKGWVEEPRMRLFTKTYEPFHELGIPMRAHMGRHTDTVERY
jgi:hypothetical protein